MTNQNPSYGQSHPHGHGHQNIVSKANEEAFDNMATTYETVPWIAKVAQQMTKELRDNIDWIRLKGSKTEGGRLLDYACGSGTVTRAMAPYFECLRGIDLSAGMLKEFDRLAEEAGYSKEKMRAIRGDLLDPKGTPQPELANAEYFDFDVATMSLAMHHVEDVETMLRQLVDRVRPGGTVFILDLVGTDRSDLPEGRGVVHGGFTEDQMRNLFEKVGLENWGWRLFSEKIEMPIIHGGTKTAFMARGTKPES